MPIIVQLLGGASLRSGDVPLSGPPAQRHRIALLALVVSAWPQPLARDRAMALLWPERDQPAARRLLNLAVHVLRSALGDRAIVTSGDGLLFDPSVARCDLHEILRAIAAATADGADAAERVVALHNGPLLDGFHLPESAEFGYWLDERRAFIAHEYMAALRTVAERDAAAGRWHECVGMYRKLVAADPHSGKYAVALMRALDAAGDRAGAIRHAAEHAQRRRMDLELDPDPDVAGLAVHLQHATGDAGKRAGDRERSASVAVLPFVNLNADAEDGHDVFAEGIAEDVIAQLSKVRALKVIARSSAMYFREQDQRPGRREIGAMLGVSSLLEGTVRRAGDQVRIVARLVDAHDESQLWAETYDRHLTDIFAVQLDVALQIATALRAELLPAERARLQRVPTGDVRAYESYMQGRSAFMRYTEGGLLESIEHFRRAIDQDPAYALAHAGIAMAYLQLVIAEGAGGLRNDVAYAHARASVTSALLLDKDSGEAHAVLGLLKFVHDYDWEGAEQEFRLALATSPGTADLHNFYGLLCSSLCRSDEALVLFRRAQELDPLVHKWDPVTELLRAERNAEALAQSRQAISTPPVSPRGRSTHGWALLRNGYTEEGFVSLEESARTEGASTLYLGQLGEAYALYGRPADAHNVLARLKEASRQRYVSPYHFAYVYTGLGDHAQALDMLERAYAERAGGTFGIKGSFRFTPLRSEPRFQALLRRMRLA